MELEVIFFSELYLKVVSFFFEIMWKTKMIDFPSIYFQPSHNNSNLPRSFLVCVLALH